MIDRKSRYRSTPIVTVTDSRGVTYPLIGFRETPATTAALVVTPTDSDRLDHLAWRFYRDPTRFWRLCDASPQLDPFDVLVPGDPMPIPPDK